jgi:hypothetical protein
VRQMSQEKRDTLAIALSGPIVLSFGFTFMDQYGLRDMMMGWVWCGVCVALVGLRVWLRSSGRRRP